jgi:hypothetical protein
MAGSVFFCGVLAGRTLAAGQGTGIGGDGADHG